MRGKEVPAEEPARDRVGHGAPTVAAALALAMLAVAARLVPLLRGGGLNGLGNYDDGVYYAAGTALLHGLLPYRDYLFLHPPGITIALAPFGLIGAAGQDPAGLAAARIVWILLGALNTLLVAQILRPAGRLEAVIGAVFYATAFPAIYIEWTPLLEGPAQTCVLAAVALLAYGDRSISSRWFVPVAAGALLGLSATFKIWGVVAVVTVIVWYLARRGWRAAGRIACGAAGAVAVVCLPFFAAAPIRMWQMVVTYQLVRHRLMAGMSRRLAAILGLSPHRHFDTLGRC